MARKFLYAVAGIIVFVIFAGVLILVFIEEITLYAITPGERFAAYEMPAAPDYRDSSAWASLPAKKDPADITPAGLTDNQSGADVDVFFIHPTTYLSAESWVADIADPAAKERVDNMVMRYQASAFNGCCRIFAPYYRQATLASFFRDNEEEGTKALLFAYEDVRRAFKQFLAERNDGRPFILAAHSQGSWHLMNLLRDEVANKDVADRMVAAYPVGYAIPEDFVSSSLGGIGVCQSAEETGCLVTWNTFHTGGDIRSVGLTTGFDYGRGIRPIDGKTYVCVNPLSWHADAAPIPASRNLGSLPANDDVTTLAQPEAGIASAACQHGVLFADLSKTEGYDGIAMPDRNLHVYDYNLFYVNIRMNAQARADAYLKAREGVPASGM